MSMTFADLIKSTLDSSKERLKNPIVGSYICAFVIFNWRPILLLAFSDEKIENRIKAVDLYYSPWYWIIISIITPIAISLVYTFLIPISMVWIDQKLEPTKEKRIKRIYKSKQFVTTEKIILAAKELDLKNAESGNKQKQDFLNEIESLKETITQRDETLNQVSLANNNTTDQLNKNLNATNTLLADMKRREEESILVIEGLENALTESRSNTYFAKEISNTLAKLDAFFAKKFIDLKEEKGGRLLFGTTANRKDSFHKFQDLMLVERIGVDDYKFTDLGSTVYNILRLHNALTKSSELNSDLLGKHIREAFKNLSTDQRSKFKRMVSSNEEVDPSKVTVNDVNEFIDLKLITGSHDTRNYILTELGRSVLQFINFNI
ncbi:hypothetical protein IRZ71_22415 [Flavobacterium sp. ANB]|uniref:hypothetical protein n=1 Tax=unclassified Flavobacterium TaxID=196869 RepID=UPI0012B971D7|nr:MULTISPECIES: hypothetical protein [unclassified Flavobacterium]MBF4519117.1 hypothetical protein [Flavobacterium sp. ANB]MTD71683.1 hypothetical protein [Flavobacterium sp. LC2016-13]